MSLATIWSSIKAVYQSTMQSAGEVAAPHIEQLALALAASLLVVYGSDINGKVRQYLKPHPWIVRMTCFVLLCMFGYGVLTVLGTRLLTGGLAAVPTVHLVPTIVGAFLLLSLLAEHRKQL